MKKKSIILLICVMVLMALSGCKKEKTASEKAISVGKKVIETVDGYLDKKLDYDQARQKIKELEDEMEYLDERDHDDKYYSSDLLVSSSITMVQSKILSDKMDSSSDSYDKLVESRNELAKKIGEKKR